MTFGDDHNYFRWLVEQGQVRPAVRAIIVSEPRGRFLVEKNHGARDKYLNFLGGGIELGESMEACIAREIIEESNAKIERMEYLFVVENFITFQGDVTHGLGHYFEVELDREDEQSDAVGIEFQWFTLDELKHIDLRPHVVRDVIIDGTYRSVRRLISRDEIV